MKNINQMKFRIYHIIILATLFIFIDQGALCQKDFFVIGYEESLKNKKSLNLTQLASNVDYIKLETNNECLIKPEARFFFVDSLIFVTNTDHILKFSKEGKFLKKIASPGRGPGEIENNISDLSIIPSKRLIIIQSLRTLLYYSFDGKFIKSFLIPYRGIVKVLKDDKVLDWNPSVYSKFTFLLINEKRDTLSYVSNITPTSKISPVAIMKSSPFFPERFYTFNNRFFFKDGSNDTVYYLNAGKIMPAYLIDLGVYKLPSYLQPEVLGFSKMDLYETKAHNFHFCFSFETSNYIFITSHSYNKFLPHDLIYNKKDHTGNLVVTSEDISNGLINDWDGGSNFWPVGNIDNNRVFMPLSIAELRKEVNLKEKLKQPIKFSDKKKQLTKMMSGSDILENPIIMIVTLR